MARTQETETYSSIGERSPSFSGRSTRVTKGVRGEVDKRYTNTQRGLHFRLGDGLQNIICWVEDVRGGSK